MSDMWMLWSGASNSRHTIRVLDRWGTIICFLVMFLRFQFSFGRDLSEMRDLNGTLSPVRNDRTLYIAYYIKLKSNTKHPLLLYSERLSHLCGVFASQQLQARLFGSLEYIRSNAHACAPYIDPDNQVKFDELAYADVVTRMRPDCEYKFSKVHTGKVRNARDLGRIWLNKINIICRAFSMYPVSRIIMLDAGLSARKIELALSLDSYQSPETPSFIGYAFNLSTQLQRNHWHGRRCDAPVLVANIIMMQREQCNSFLPVYNHYIERVSKEAAGANDKLNECSCFDEEDVLSRIYRERPNSVNRLCGVLSQDNNQRFC